MLLQLDGALSQLLSELNCRNLYKIVRWRVAEIEVSLEDIIDRMELRLFKAAHGHSHSLFLCSATGRELLLICDWTDGIQSPSSLSN